MHFIFIALHLDLNLCLLPRSLSPYTSQYLSSPYFFSYAKTTWQRIAKFILSVINLASCFFWNRFLGSLKNVQKYRFWFLLNPRWRLKKMTKERAHHRNGARIRPSFPETSLMFVLILCYKGPCISISKQSWRYFGFLGACFVQGSLDGDIWLGLF